MSITVSDCLKLPSLRSATVIAGKKGLDHIVNNVSVLEIFDDDVFKQEWPVSNGDLLLTSFNNIKEDYRLQCRHIENMCSLGDAALVIYYVGIYLDQVHPSLIETADRLDFPLIIMPEKQMDCLYNQVLSEVYESLFHDRARGRNLIDTIASLVSRLPENRKNINTLLQLISDNLKATVLLSDMSMNNISFCKWPASNKITADEIFQLYEAGAAKGEYLIETTYEGMPAHVFCVPFDAFEYRNFSLYLMDDFGTLELDNVYNIIEILQIFSKLWNLDADNILENALVPAIIEGEETRMHQIAAKLGINISSINTMVIIRPSQNAFDAKQQLQLKREMIRTIKEYSRMMGKEIIIDTYGLYIILFLVYSPSAESDLDYAEAIMQSLDEITTRYTLSVFTCDDNVTDVRKTYLLYTDYIEQAVETFPLKKELTYGDLLFVKNCCMMLKENSDDCRICRNILKPVFEGIADGTVSDGPELLNTLAVYCLDADCEVKTTASMLYIHRNTVQYRLNKIQSITNFRPADRLDFHLMYTAIACWRLENSSENTK